MISVGKYWSRIGPKFSGAPGSGLAGDHLICELDILPPPSVLFQMITIDVCALSSVVARFL
jgi:hypothetical protein